KNESTPPEKKQPTPRFALRGDNGCSFGAHRTSTADKRLSQEASVCINCGRPARSLGLGALGSTISLPALIAGMRKQDRIASLVTAIPGPWNLTAESPPTGDWIRTSGAAPLFFSEFISSFWKDRSISYRIALSYNDQVRAILVFQALASINQV